MIKQLTPFFQHSFHPFIATKYLCRVG